jgi:hypothetical protein
MTSVHFVLNINTGLERISIYIQSHMTTRDCELIKHNKAKLRKET